MKNGVKIVLVAVVILLGSFLYSRGYVKKFADGMAENMSKVICRYIAPGHYYYINIDKKVVGIGESFVNTFLPAGGYVSENLAHNAGMTALEKATEEAPLPAPTEQHKSQIQPETEAQTESREGKVVLFKGIEEVPPETQKPTEAPTASKNPVAVNANSAKLITGSVYSKAQLVDYNFLMSKFYTVPNATELGPDKLRPDEFLEKNLAIEKVANEPQILIFHTHSQETFVDSIPGDTSTSIVGVGDYLATLLHDKYGYNCIHDTTVYDLVNGKLDRSEAYTYAEQNVQKILDANPGIKVVIDLHRDGVDSNTHLVTTVNGKPTAKIMFFNGLSYSRLNGDITHLPNPNRDDNLAMSLQMQLLGEAYYPGFLRRIYVNAYRYSLHMAGRSLLVEAGAQNNTVDEVKNAMEPLADILDKLLRGEKAY